MTGGSLLAQGVVAFQRDCEPLITILIYGPVGYASEDLEGWQDRTTAGLLSQLRKHLLGLRRSADYLT